MTGSNPRSLAEFIYRAGESWAEALRANKGLGKGAPIFTRIGYDSLLSHRVHKRGSDRHRHCSRVFQDQIHRLEDAMQVSVLVKDGCDGEETPLLVLPFGGASGLPQHLRMVRWRELATASTDDRLFWPEQSRIEDDIERDGYSLLAA